MPVAGDTLVPPPSSPVRRRVSSRLKGTVSKQPEVVEVACAPRHLAPWGVAIAAVVILAVVVFGIVSYMGQPPRAWSAVFLTNGQVYFGYTARVTPHTIELRDVYYLQVTPPLQQRTEGQPAPQPDITLVKLGNELHGPTDAMAINREHVLFTEELRDNSTIVQAIAAARDRAGTPSVSAPQTAPTPAPSPEVPAVEGGMAPASE